MAVQILSRSYRPLVNISRWTIHRYWSQKKCAEYDDPKCSKETLGKQKPCPSKIRQMEGMEEKPTGKSMWENPDCCKDPCPDYHPRFDELYYESSDKLLRKYQQTWISCPKLEIKPKKICVYEQLNVQPMEKRARKIRPRTACPVGAPRICMDKRNRLCPKVVMPGCRVGRLQPKCVKIRPVVDVVKECAPYPSYSECIRNKEDDLHPRECKCLDHPMMCEVWHEMRRRLAVIKT